MVRVSATAVFGFTAVSCYKGCAMGAWESDEEREACVCRLESCGGIVRVFLSVVVKDGRCDAGNVYN